MSRTSPEMRGAFPAVMQRLPTLSLVHCVEGISTPPERDHPDLQVWNDHQGSGAIFCQVLGGQHWIWWPGLASYCFDFRAHRVDVCCEPRAYRSAVVDAYWRYILPIIEHVLGKECLHASAVRGRDGVVVLCGESMNGKSTIAYGLQKRGYPLWADDSVVFEMVDGVACTIPIPFRLHLRKATLSHFSLKSDAAVSWPEFYDDSHRPCEVVSTIIVLERSPDGGSGKVSEAYRILPHEALIMLLNHARCFTLKDEERKRQMMQNYMHLVSNVPVIRLRFRSGFERLSAIMDQIEDQIASNDPLDASGGYRAG